MSFRQRVIVSVVSVAVLAIAGLLVFGREPSDEQQIREALRDSIQAGKEGRPGGMLEILSRDFNYDAIPYEQARAVQRYIRDGKPDVTLDNWRPEIDGDLAVIKTAATIKVGIPFNTTFTFPDCTLTFRRERASRFLVFPGTKWRLWRADTRNANPTDLIP
ncbi:MAG: hypothetical protein HZC36_07260 [Armatimonadetes bacterium]|nr:hypothetical protein [Armatimonadota bacterium]